MSHPDPRHDPENVRKNDSMWAKREEPSSAKGKAIKAFGSEYSRKSNKRLMKKSKNYRIKHF